MRYNYKTIPRICLECTTEFFAEPHQITKYGANFCSHKCSSTWHARKWHPKTPEERFWEKVNKTETCWLWTGHTSQNGYGRFWLNKRNIQAHRFSWGLVNGPVPDGFILCHNCPDGDNPACVRQSHLFLGTNADNSADMVRKGRQSHGEEHTRKILPNRPRGENHHTRLHPETAPRGVKNGNAKLTREQSGEIRDIYKQGNTSLNNLSQRFSVSKKTIFNIIHNKIWV
jgi:hypothetical protein